MMSSCFQGNYNVDKPNILLIGSYPDWEVETCKTMGKLVHYNLAARFDVRNLVTPIP